MSRSSRIAAFVALAGLAATGCTVVSVATTAVGVATTAVGVAATGAGLAVDATVGTAKAVGSVAGALAPSADDAPR